MQQQRRQAVTDPIFFFVRRTARQVRVHAATAFNGADGTFQQMARNHPQAYDAAHVLDTFAIVARDMPASLVNVDALVKGAARYMVPDIHARLVVIPSTGKLPRRVCLRAAGQQL
jgi:hypothetical protein